MTSRTPATAMDIAQTVFDAKLGRQFQRAVREFVHVLRTVAGYGPGEISGGSIQVLRHLAERVIEQIERRLESSEDRPSLQQELATAVYDIRSALEEIDRWQRQWHQP
jgi:hypothetical protein